MKKKYYWFVLGALSMLVGTGSLIWYYTAQKPDAQISDYNQAVDLPFVLEQFKENWYWLVAEDSADYDPAYTFTHLLSSKDPAEAQPITVKMYRVAHKPVAFIVYYMKNMFRGFIWFVVVQEQFRKAGYGLKLFNYALDDLKKRGALTVDLITRTNNSSGQALYKKAGFKETWRNEGFVFFEKKLL